MYFRFIAQPAGIPTISNRLYLKLCKLGYKYEMVIVSRLVPGKLLNHVD